MRTSWKIRSKLGLLKENREYYVYLEDINVPTEYKKSRIGQAKWEHKVDHYRETGELESTILLDRDFNLVDGYSSYKIAVVYDLEKVPVRFVSTEKA